MNILYVGLDSYGLSKSVPTADDMICSTNLIRTDFDNILRSFKVRIFPFIYYKLIFYIVYNGFLLTFLLLGAILEF